MSHSAHLNLRIALVGAILIGCLYLWRKPQTLDVTLRFVIAPKVSP